MNENQRTITLVTIPQEVAEAIVWARAERGESIPDIIDRVRRIGSCGGPHTDALRSIPFDMLLSALINGYTVEKSAEEVAHDRIRKSYYFRKAYADSVPDAAYIDGILSTLETLDIKIEGVNA